MKIFLFLPIHNKKLTVMTLLAIGYMEIIIIALVILLLFGGRKIPELMRGLGKGVKSFKDGMNGKEETPEDNTPK